LEPIDVPPKNPEIGSKDDKGKADDDDQVFIRIFMYADGVDVILIGPQ
jgi:hypothetical protein